MRVFRCFNPNKSKQTVCWRDFYRGARNATSIVTYIEHVLELPALRSGVIAPSVAGALTGRQSADDLVFRDSGDVVARAPEGVSAAGSIAAGISAAARRGESWAQSERHTEVCAGPQDSDEAASRLHHGADLAAGAMGVLALGTLAAVVIWSPRNRRADETVTAPRMIGSGSRRLWTGQPTWTAELSVRKAPNPSSQVRPAGRSMVS